MFKHGTMYYISAQKWKNKGWKGPAERRHLLIPLIIALWQADGKLVSPFLWVIYPFLLGKLPGGKLRKRKLRNVWIYWCGPGTFVRVWIQFFWTFTSAKHNPSTALHSSPQLSTEPTAQAAEKCFADDLSGMGLILVDLKGWVCISHSPFSRVYFDCHDHSFRATRYPPDGIMEHSVE